MVEFRVAPGTGDLGAASFAEVLTSHGLTIEPDHESVPMGGDGMEAPSYVISGTVRDVEIIRSLEALPDVIKVWHDTEIAPFDSQ